MGRAVAVMVGVVVLGCSTTTRYESVCQLIERDVVERDADGNATLVDLELEWDPCPGDQFQAVRGGAEFARCMERYEVGDAVPVTIRHWWDTRGYYRWDLESVGDCAHEIEPDASGSFEKSQECHDVVQHGAVVGFECNRQPFEELVSVCPWMARE